MSPEQRREAGSPPPAPGPGCPSLLTPSPGLGRGPPLPAYHSMYSWNPRDTFSLSQPELYGRTKSYKKWGMTPPRFPRHPRGRAGVTHAPMGGLRQWAVILS